LADLSIRLTELRTGDGTHSANFRSGDVARQKALDSMDASRASTRLASCTSR
jgi:hypothetical protein